MRPDLAALRPDTPSYVISLMRQCWAQDPSRRPSAMEVATALDALLEVVVSRAAGISDWDEEAGADSVSRFRALMGSVWAAAEAGDLTCLRFALGTGGSANEADSVRRLEYVA